MFHGCAHVIHAIPVYNFGCYKCVCHNCAAVDTDILFVPLVIKYFDALECFAKGLFFRYTVANGVPEIYSVGAILHNFEVNVESCGGVMLCYCYAHFDD